MPTLFAILGIGQWEILVICGIILLLFGHRLPSLMRSLGRGVTEFKTGLNSTVSDEPAEEPEDAKAKK